MNNKKSTSDLQRTGIFVTLLAAAFITAMSTTVTGNMIPNFTEFFTLIGSNITAVRSVYGYFVLVTMAIAVAIILYLKSENKKVSDQ